MNKSVWRLKIAFPRNNVPEKSVPAAQSALPPIVKRFRRTPYMGWSSWNQFHVKISEEIIRAQADAMAPNGMADCGYKFINIDDGFFGGHDAAGTTAGTPVGTEIWARPLGHVLSGRIAIALLNRGNVPAQISLDIATLGIVPANGYTARDCWEHKFLGSNGNSVPEKLTFPQLTFTVPAHGIIVLTLTGTPAPFNLFQEK